MTHTDRTDIPPLPMPSDVSQSPGQTGGGADQPLVEPPSAKLLVRLFLIPFIIVAVAVGIVFLISRMTGSEPTVDQAFTQLEKSGGERTAGMLVGPGSKQRYMAAKAITDHMKRRMSEQGGMDEAERIAMSARLTKILKENTHETEGDVRHFLLIALGRTWQVDPSQPPMDSPQARESRKQTVQTLSDYGRVPDVMTRKAAILAMAYLRNRDEARAAIPLLIETLNNGREDLDVRMAAATALGPLASPDDQNVIDALMLAYRESDRRNAELAWSAALSLAQLNHAEVAQTILMLLDREQLAQLEVYDRETDPNNPQLRKLSEQEQQRILINTMIGAANLQVPEIQQRMKHIAENDPSPRVREAALQIAAEREKGGVAVEANPID